MAGKILLTGGCGYIGSHICLELIEQGYRPVVLDNLSNSSPIPLQRIEQLTGQSIPFVRGDVRDEATLDRLFNEYAIDGHPPRRRQIRRRIGGRPYRLLPDQLHGHRHPVPGHATPWREALHL